MLTDDASRIRDMERRLAALEAAVRTLVADRRPQRDPLPEIRFSPNGPYRVVSTNDSEGRLA